MEKTQSEDRSSSAMDNCGFDILTQTEKKADFLHSAVDTYIEDAKAANRQDLVRLWNSIKQDEKRHFDMLKKELSNYLQER
jgi:rubrerythrin